MWSNLLDLLLGGVVFFTLFLCVAWLFSRVTRGIEKHDAYVRSLEQREYEQLVKERGQPPGYVKMADGSLKYKSNPRWRRH